MIQAGSPRAGACQICSHYEPYCYLPGRVLTMLANFNRLGLTLPHITDVGINLFLRRALVVMTTELRFVVDVNVGRLAKWLRVMGYDTLFPRDGSDNDLVRIALREHRVLITRDRRISLRRSVRQGQMRVVHILQDDLRSQLRQLVQDLKLDLAGGFSRCVCCNQLLDSVDTESVADRLPHTYSRTTGISWNVLSAGACIGGVLTGRE